MAGAGRLALGVLALCAGLNLLARGVADTYAVFLVPLAEAFAVERGVLTGVYSVYMLVYGLAAPLAGIAFDRFGPRAVYAAGLACLGGGYFAAGGVSAVWQLYLLIGFIGGIGSVALGIVPASGLVSRWFRRRLPSAMSVLHAALGIGVLLFAPLTQWLIERAGWRGAYHIIGLALLALAPLLLLLLPWRRITAGHPEYAERAADAPPPGARGALARALRMPAFWGLFTVMFVTALATFAVLVQLVAYLVEVGFAPLEAASLYGTMGMLSIVGMLAAGALAERFEERYVATLSYSSTILGIGVLALLAWYPSFVLAGAFVLLFGTMQGSRGPLVTTLAARLFARSGFGAVYGCISLGMGLGGALGSWSSGALHDVTGSYGAGYVLAAAAAGAGIALFWLVGALAQPATSRTG
jgi:MFS family permease